MQNIEEPQLTRFQKQSIALIYYVTSRPYLEKLLTKLDDLIQYTGGVVDLADQQYRDRVLLQEGWEMGDTSANWSTYAYPSLLDFRLGLIRIIEETKQEKYGWTPAYNTARMLGEFQPNWMSEEEEEGFKTRFDELYRLCSYYDYCVKPPRSWSLYILFEVTKELGIFDHNVPKLKIRTNIRVNSGEIIPKTGVYIPIGDQYGSPQFAWTHQESDTFERGWLEKCETLNALGKQLFSKFNEYTAWIPSEELRAFALENIKRKKIVDDWNYMQAENAVQIELAPSLLANNVFSGVDCSWYFVELVEGEFEELGGEGSDIFVVPDLKVLGGELCPRTGFWVLSNNSDKRLFFTKGTSIPKYNKHWGDEYWVFDGDE
ncbi:hypothetical protein D7V64_05485 [Acinetobacter cumulans]|uniref:DUF3396 domain-containing protein n=1 Tax=Acinetobacter cumulans TaxID=2136182 RepID=A0A3A8G5E5_9GAMM|nr:hypothetical protein [Acinetobacter cumulans]RKG53868.1 hypothetical protein D7V64_05485 [Acinetobacter cumulans]RLL35973.1 hypothetical protein D9K79_18200 [Acinetobacter cumulans]